MRWSSGAFGMALGASLLSGCGAQSPATGLEAGTNHDTLTFPATGAATTHLGGGVLPCLTEGKRATVRAVSADVEPSSVTVRYYLRRIPAEVERTQGSPIEWAPMVSWDGTLAAANRAGDLRGEIEPLRRGTTFELPCRSGERDVALPMDEVVIEVSATTQGARVRDVAIDYELGGESGRAPVLLDINVCGSAVRTGPCEGYTAPPE